VFRPGARPRDRVGTQSLRQQWIALPIIFAACCSVLLVGEPDLAYSGPRRLLLYVKTRSHVVRAPGGKSSAA
jgi:hypothetical protein